MNGKTILGLLTSFLVPLIAGTLWFNTQINQRPTIEQVWGMIDRTVNQRFDQLERRFDRLDKKLDER